MCRLQGLRPSEVRICMIDLLVALGNTLTGDNTCAVTVFGQAFSVYNARDRTQRILRETMRVLAITVRPLLFCLGSSGAKSL